jgi:battenin
VFISRSSGLLIPPSIALLWFMPFLQLLLLIFFILDGVFQFWFSWSLLSLCFVVGLLGGAVYVSGFSLISRDTKEEFKEMAMVRTSRPLPRARTTVVLTAALCL